MTAGAVFDAAARDYDRSRRQLVPCFDAFYGAVLAAIDRDPAETFRVLDLGAGTGLLSALVAEAFPKATFRLADLAPAMLDRAKKRFGDAARFRYMMLNLAETALPGDFDLVISSLAIHHLADPDKAALFARVHQALKPGGRFINADQFRDPDPASDAALHAAWLDAVRATGIAEAEIAAALRRMDLDRNATIADQLGWLRDAGFHDPTIAFEQYFFVVYHGTRPR